MLRLKGERDDSMTDEVGNETVSGEFEEPFRDHPAFESGSLPHGDEFEDDGERDGRWSILSHGRGLAIAAAAFVPTFLLVFLGVPYLLEDPSLARTPNNSTVTYARDPESGSGWSLTNSLSEALRGGPLDNPLLFPPSAPPATPAAPPPVTATPPAPAPPPTPAAPTAPPAASTPADAPPSATTEVPPAKSPMPSASARASEAPAARGDEGRSREQTAEPMPGTSSSSASRPSSSADSGAVTPSLPPAPSRVPEPERKAVASKPVLEHRSASTPRQAAAIPDPSRSQGESRKGSGDWTPAAAFADRDAAARLASSIERQGYPVEVRQEASSTRPWVVWIGSQPSGGGRRR